MSKDKSEPAFPVMACANESGLIEYHRQGMTLRDYFAAKALQGLCAAMGPDYSPARIINGEGVAQDAYYLADDMLKAREA